MRKLASAILYSESNRRPQNEGNHIPEPAYIHEFITSWATCPEMVQKNKAVAGSLFWRAGNLVGEIRQVHRQLENRGERYMCRERQ